MLGIVAPNVLNIVHETSHAAVAIWRQVVVLVVRDRFTQESLDAAVSALEQQSQEAPTCLLTIVGERTQLPDPAVMKTLVKALQNGRAVCRARVVPGQGMRPTATRWMLENADTSSGNARPNESFATIQEAADWLGRTMSKDVAWRLQLATVAGTLLYGSPSFSRRSQVARYLAGEDVAGKRSPERVSEPEDPHKPKRR